MPASAYCFLIATDAFVSRINRINLNKTSINKANLEYLSNTKNDLIDFSFVYAMWCEYTLFLYISAFFLS